MTDIVERLRQGLQNCHSLRECRVREAASGCECAEAADEIERLREQVAALQASSGYEASIAQVEIERLRAVLEAMILNMKNDGGEYRDCYKNAVAVMTKSGT